MYSVTAHRARSTVLAAVAAGVLAAPALARGEDPAPAPEAPATESPQTAPGRFEGVTVTRYLMGRVKPVVGARGVAYLWTNTGFSMRRAVYPVLRHKLAQDGSEWLQVRALRNRTQVDVWIPRWATRRVWLDYRIAIDLSSRRTTVYRRGEVVKRFRVVIGKRSTPTPTGNFYVVDRVRLPSSWAQRKMALPISAFSGVLKTFDGGIGQIALHPRALLRDRVGTAASNGCIRFNDSEMAWLVKRIPRGTPVEITR